MKILGVVSGKGGVGKTTTVTNLAVLLARHYKRRVLAVDTNILAPNLGMHYGIYNYGKTFVEVLRGEATIEEAVQVHSSGVHILAAHPAPSLLKGPTIHLESTLRGLKGYDYVILDTAPGLEREIFPVLETCDEVLIVTNPEYPSVIDAKRTIELAKQSRVLIRGVELNRYRKERWGLSPVDVQYVCEVPVISVIPDRDEVRRSISTGFPVVIGAPRSPAALEMRRLAAFLLGERYEETLAEKVANLLWFRRRLAVESALRKAPTPPLPPPREMVRMEALYPVPERELPIAERSGPAPVRAPEPAPAPPPVRRVEPPPPPPVVEPVRSFLPPEPSPAPPARPTPAQESFVPPSRPPTFATGERKGLLTRKELIENLLASIQRQHERGYMPEDAYSKLKEVNEAKLREIEEKLKR